MMMMMMMMVMMMNSGQGSGFKNLHLALEVNYSLIAQSLKS